MKSVPEVLFCVAFLDLTSIFNSMKSKANKIYKSPYVIVCVSVWIVWGLITFTERIYYSNYPEDVFFIWLKVGLVQVFHGIWVTFLLFWVYKKLFYRSLSLPIKALYVIILTYVFSFGLVLLNNPTYMFFF